MSGSGRDALGDVQKWSGGTPGCPGVVTRPSGMSGRGREAHPDFRELSRSPPKCPEVVEKPSQRLGVVRSSSGMFWSGRKAIPTSGSGREVLPDVREW